MDNYDCYMKLKRFAYFLPVLFCSMQFLFGQQCNDQGATPQTKALYKNLHHLIGKNILLGHQDDPCYGVNWKYINGRSDIRDVTGQYPSIYGFDLGRIELDWTNNLDSVPFDKTRLFIREAYDRGGVITLSWHLNNPMTGGTAWDNKPGTVASILPGGEKNALYKIWMDRMAVFLNSLKGKNGESIPIILRLFHELNGSWFWWGKNQCSPDEMKQLWRYSIHYLRDEKKLHNLLFAFNTDKFYSGEEYLERYPGDDLIDIMGFDIYQKDEFRENASFIKFFNKDLSLLDSVAKAHGKIPALTEFGYNLVPDKSWWTEVFFPALSSHQIVYALAWRNAGKKQDGSIEFYVPYPGAVSASDFKKMSGSGKILFETGIKSINIYK